MLVCLFSVAMRHTTIIVFTTTSLVSTSRPALQVAAFEAVCELVRSASADTLDMVAALLPVFLGRIEETFNMPVTSGARSALLHLVGAHCHCAVVVWLGRAAETLNMPVTSGARAALFWCAGGPSPAG